MVSIFSKSYKITAPLSPPLKNIFLESFVKANPKLDPFEKGDLILLS